MPPSVHQLREGFEAMILINLENWCYANTATLTLLWALLSCSTYSNMEWGPHGPDIVRFLHTALQKPVHLPDLDWFQSLIASWHHQDEQCDPVEFLTHLVQGLQVPGIDWSWERRVQLGSDISVRDKSANHVPITLHIDPELSHAGWIRLDDMIHTWFNYMGMQTALTGSTPIICFHVDRHVMAGDGTTHKSDLSIGMHGVFSVPFFTNDRTELAWHDYRVVAAIAHLGADQAGHCRATLRVQADVSHQPPYMQLLTDDNAQPSRCWHEPMWFLQNVICIWLCSVDTLDLHSCSSPSHMLPDDNTSPNDALMRLLRQFG